MKRPLLNRVLLIAALAATWCHGQQNPPPEALLEALRQLPEVVLDRKTEFEAKYLVLPSGELDIQTYGFAFKTPNLVDGPATWLVVWDHENPDAGVWQVTKVDGTVLAMVSTAPDDLAKYPDLAAKFPKGKSVQRLSIPNYNIVKATRYQAILTTREKTPPLGISINVAASGVGARPGEEIREMEIPKGSISSQQVMELVENIRTFRGDAAGIAFLEAQFAERAGSNGDFSALFFKVWNEAQFGAGMQDPAWSSRLNDAAFTSAYGSGRYAQGFEILNNLCARLVASGRYGRLAEVHAILEDAYRKGGMSMDPSTFPDLGPAIPSLPGIRHRKITMETPYSKQLPAGPPAISRPSAFNDMQASALLNYSSQRLNRGDWKGGLEWAVWVRDWATDAEGNLIQARNSNWYSATFSVAANLESLGYTEEALAVIAEAVAAPYGQTYRGRDKISAALRQLELMREVGRPDPEMIPKLRELITQIENHVHFGRSGAWGAKILLAEALFDGGQVEEGDGLLEQIIREGSLSARWTRLDRWLATGRTEGVEAELIALLRNTREGGHKISELGLYSRYADFLEATGRFTEALAMRREAIRLARDFNGFTRLPGQLAKLAALLHKLGHADLATQAADEARSLLKDGNMPPSTVKGVNESLARIVPATPVPPKDPEERKPEVDLQPHRGLVIPLEGAPWTGYLTLANPGANEIRGMLKISGAPLTAKVDGETGDIRVDLIKAQGDGHAGLPMTLAPGSYRLITIAADAENAGDGELEFAWRSIGEDKGADASILIDKREQGVAGSIIQAGDYQANPFYGVPIHLSYVAKDQRTKSSPLRFRASQAARIEIYRLDGTPLAVDGAGNGSLLDPGDELFTETDGAGNLLVGLADGAAPLKIVAYPQGRIEADGLKIDIEAFDGGEWSLHSSNRIEP